MRTLTILVLCLALTPLAISGLAQREEIQVGAPFTAIVTASEARFFFPLADRPRWEWYLRSTPISTLEYEWAVEVENGGNLYSFGFFLFKPPGGAPGHGDLRALIGVGQASVATAVGAAKSRMTELPNGRVRIGIAEGLLILVVDDPTTLRMLFSEHPPLATLRVHVPGAPDATRQVKTTYSS